jgi:hypothetical protein
VSSMEKKITRTEVYDDLDGKIIDDGMAQKFEYSWEGKDYVLDLRPTNAEKLDKLMKPYLEASTEVGKAAKRTRSTSTASGRAPSGSGRSKEELQAVRDWAAKNGHEVSPRGRIKAEILEAFDAAHK